MARSPVAVATPLLLLLCLSGRAACDVATLVKCVKPELRPCYCGKTTYDRQELYAVNCTGTGLDPQRSRDVFVNLPDETEASPGYADFLGDGTGVNRERLTAGTPRGRIRRPTGLGPVCPPARGTDFLPAGRRTAFETFEAVQRTLGGFCRRSKPWASRDEPVSPLENRTPG